METVNETLRNNPLLPFLLDGLPVAVLVLGEERKICLANTVAARFGQSRGIQSVLDMRPGDLLGCEHACETGAVCGATEFCGVCGASNAIISAQHGAAEVKECRIITKGGGALDLRVWATPLTVEGQCKVLFSIIDITDDKRRRVLERLFFHDVINAVGAMKGAAELMKQVPADQKDELSDIIYMSAQNALEVITSQRQLAAAESGELAVNLDMQSSLAILQQLKSLYEVADIATGKIVAILPDSQDVIFKSDAVLLSRVIGNMLKNALEAVNPGQTVTMKSERYENMVRFTVHNPTVMTEDVQHQVFQRSFSTKGNDRGLGTYSMRLFSEKYLNGHVSFSSTVQEGTMFIAEYPLS